jgi:hypothetical protein
MIATHVEPLLATWSDRLTLIGFLALPLAVFTLWVFTTTERDR